VTGVPISVRSKSLRQRRAGGVLLALAVLAVFPLIFSNATVTTIGVYCLMYMAMATAWNTFSGFSGYVSLGHAVFFGTGAYTTALMASHFHLAGGYGLFGVALLGGLVAGVAAVPIGIVALRTRRHTFVVITIAVFFIFQLLATVKSTRSCKSPSGHGPQAATDLVDVRRRRAA